MPDASGFDIFIWGGSETVARGGRHLAEQRDELQHIMAEFKGEVSSENELFNQAVGEMQAQEGRSSNLSSEAQNIYVSRVNEAELAIRDEFEAWDNARNGAGNALGYAESMKSDIEYKICCLENEINTCHSSIQSLEGHIQTEKDEIDNRERSIENGKDSTGYSPCDDLQVIQNCEESIERFRSELKEYSKKCHKYEQALNRLQALLGPVEAKITAANNILSQAESGLNVVRQHEDRLESIKDAASSNQQKAQEANEADCRQLSAICNDRKLSAKKLDSLQEDAVDQQEETDTTLEGECDVLQDVAECMAAYEDFSLRG